MAPELTPKQIKNLERLAKVVDEGNIGVLENLLETEEKMEKMEEEVEQRIEKLEQKFEKVVEEVKASAPDMKLMMEQIRGKDGKDGQSIVGPQGPRGPQGPAGRTPRDGRDGRDGKDGQSIVGPPGPAGKDADEVAIQDRIEKNLPSLGGAVRDGLELLPEGEKLKIDAIQDLRKELDEVKKRQSQINVGGISQAAARDLVKDIDLSSQLDGVTKTFNIQGVWNVISVSLDSFPYGALRKNIDFTWTPTSVTFTSTIDAATQLASGQKCILTVIQG